jgi:hypothetical protein
MMTALLLYGYCSGLDSSRRIIKACAERVDFTMIIAHDALDFRTLGDLGSIIWRRWRGCYCRC